MYANVRQYRIDASRIDEAAHLADTELADRLSEEPGFVAYEVIAEGGEICAMTIFEDREGAERSEQIAAQFVAEHLAEMGMARVGGMTGEVMVSRARERVLEPAHH